MDLIERSKDQYRTDREGSFLVDAPPIPRNMMVELSNACNHACIFCPNPHMKRTKRLIDNALLFRVIDEAAELGVREIGFYTTGDPFIHKGLVSFTAHAKKAGFDYIYISTNGGLASPERAKAAIDAGMNSIKFSVNAGSQETYKQIHGVDDWDKVIENLRFISDYREKNRLDLKLYVTCVVTKIMEHEVESLRELLTPLVDQISFDPCMVLALPDAGEGTPQEGICHLPFNRLHVTQEGYLTLCCVDFQNYLALADLNELSLKNAWTSDRFRAMRKRHLTGDLTGTLCGRCWNAERCHVDPVVPEYADPIDFDAFDEIQRTAIRDELQVQSS